jgi:hypothetical protein
MRRNDFADDDLNQLMSELGLDSSRPLPHVRISSKMADTSHSASAVKEFYSQLTKQQVGFQVFKDHYEPQVFHEFFNLENLHALLLMAIQNNDMKTTN